MLQTTYPGQTSSPLGILGDRQANRVAPQESAHTPEPEIISQLKQLNLGIDLLQATIQKLDNRLEPIMSGPYPSTPEKDNKETLQSSVGRALYDHNQKLSQLTSYINSLINRVQL